MKDLKKSTDFDKSGETLKSIMDNSVSPADFIKMNEKSRIRYYPFRKIFLSNPTSLCNERFQKISRWNPIRKKIQYENYHSQSNGQISPIRPMKHSKKQYCRLIKINIQV
jgi:hypothetical protein